VTEVAVRLGNMPALIRCLIIQIWADLVVRRHGNGLTDGCAIQLTDTLQQFFKSSDLDFFRSEVRCSLLRRRCPHSYLSIRFNFNR
jgi:hypothetical protein